ncbi:MAG: antibiotic biosynthesis monooxygenase [Spirosoma sp.]|nr:antibiotic biosynthesis monooxygenase [Spirosoma sp.]
MTPQKQTKYGLFGKLKATSGKGNELASILLEASRLMADAQGCHIYIVSQDTQDDTLIWITEVWDTREDHDNSLNMPGVKELISRAIPLIEGKPESGMTLTVLGGKGLD